MTTSAYIHDTGNSNPVIFLHAFPLTADMWLRQHDGLRNRIISFDFPGFGRSIEVEEGDGFNGYIEALINMMDKLSIESAVLAGCSMGGYVAMEALAQHPGRIRGLILSNTRMGADTEAAKENRHTQRAEVLEHGTSTLIEAMLPKLVAPGTQDSNPGLLHQLRAIMGSSPAHGIAEGLQAMAMRRDSEKVLTDTSIPVCIIAGAEDQLIPVSEAEAMHEVIAESELHVLEGSGHLSCMEQPKIFNTIVSDFIAKMA
jgi:pimeloyl-ACP methyl ester carboxylesterase